METSWYRVDSRMIPAVVIAMAAGVALLFIEGFTQRGLLLLLLLAPFYYLGVEILARAVRIDETGLTITKFLRSVRFDWSEIRSLAAVRSGARIILVVQGDQGRPTFITNTLRPFDALAEDLLQRVPPETVAHDVPEILANAPTKNGPLIQAWVVCLVLTGMVAARLTGYG